MNNPDEPVMYLIFNKSLKMSKGKVAAQAGHAVGRVVREIESGAEYFDDSTYLAWDRGSYAKVALAVPDTETLLELYKTFDDNGFIVKIIQDEGRTEIEVGSFTCMAIEPMLKSHHLVQQYLAHLPLY